MRLDKYIGRTVELIYLDAAGKISQRQVVIRAVEGSTIRAYCLTAGAPRTFRLDSVLAVQPISKHNRGGRTA